MKKLTIVDRTICSNADIYWLKSVFDGQLDESIVDFICVYGGTETREYIFSQENTPYTVSYFLPIDSTCDSSIRMLLPFVRDPEENYSRNDLLPFAQDAGAAVYLVSTGGADKGQVYFFQAGFDDPLLKVANSFEDFINKLEPERQDQ